MSENNENIEVDETDGQSSVSSEKTSLFGKIKNFTKNTGTKTISKVATGLRVSNPVAVGIVSTLCGTGVLGLFGMANTKNDAPIYDDNAWICEQDELEKLDSSMILDINAAEVQKKNAAIMYDTFSSLGYSDHFIQSLIACMLVECGMDSNRLESDFIMQSEKAQFNAIAGPGTGADAATTRHAYAEYCKVWQTDGGWNGNDFYLVNVEGEGQITACGIGMIQWTAGRALNLINGVDAIESKYSVMDIEYQLAFMLAEIETNEAYKGVRVSSDEWNTGDINSTLSCVFGTLVFGKNPPAADHLQKRAERLDEAKALMDGLEVTNEYSADITSMVELLMDGTIEAAVKKNTAANTCMNDSQMKTVSISESALSIAWLKGGHYEDEKAAYNDIKRATMAQVIINDWDYIDGVNNADSSGTKETHTKNGFAHTEHCDIGKHDLIACTEYYYFAHLLVLPNELGTDSKKGFFSSCDRGVCTPVRMSGSDDMYPAGDPQIQLAYMIGTERTGADMEKWNATGFFRGYDLYSYSNALILSPDTILVTWDNASANRITSIEGTGTGTGTDELNYYNELSLEAWNNLRFAPASTSTHDHIILYVGDANIKKYYGEEFLKDQFDRFGKGSDAASDLLKGDYNVPELPEKMKKGLEYKSTFATKASDHKYTFYDALAEDIAGGLHVLKDPITEKKAAFNRKTGLKNFAAYSQIKYAIIRGDDSSNKPITYSGTYTKDLLGPSYLTNWYDINVENPEWRFELLADYEYRSLQFERFAMASMMCSNPTEEDANIYQPFTNAHDKDATILGNIYRDMSYRKGWSDLTYSETLGLHYVPDDSKYDLLYFIMPTQNDMLQDLLQLETKETIIKEHYDPEDGTFKPLVTRNLGAYGITGYDYKVLSGKISGGLAGNYKIAMGSNVDKFNNTINAWMTTGLYTRDDGIKRVSNSNRNKIYGDEIFGINPFTSMTTEERLKFINKYFYCDNFGNPAMKVFAVIDSNNDGKVSYKDAYDEAKDHSLVWNDFVVALSYKDDETRPESIIASNPGRTGLNAEDGDHQNNIAAPLWGDEALYLSIVDDTSAKDFRVYSGKGVLVYNSASNDKWIKNNNYCDCSKQYCDGDCTFEGEPCFPCENFKKECTHPNRYGTDNNPAKHLLSCAGAGCTFIEPVSYTKTFALTLDCTEEHEHLASCYVYVYEVDGTYKIKTCDIANITHVCSSTCTTDCELLAAANHKCTINCFKDLSNPRVVLNCSEEHVHEDTCYIEVTDEMSEQIIITKNYVFECTHDCKNQATCIEANECQHSCGEKCYKKVVIKGSDKVLLDCKDTSHHDITKPYGHDEECFIAIENIDAKARYHKENCAHVHSSLEGCTYIAGGWVACGHYNKCTYMTNCFSESATYIETEAGLLFTEDSQTITVEDLECPDAPHLQDCDCDLAMPCPEEGCENNTDKDLYYWMYDKCVANGDDTFYIVIRTMDPGSYSNSEKHNWDWDDIESKLGIVEGTKGPDVTATDRVYTVKYNSQGAIINNFITSGSDEDNNNTHKGYIIAYFDAKGYLLCNHASDDNNAKGDSTSWTVAKASCHRHCLSATQSLEYRWTHAYNTNTKQYYMITPPAGASGEYALKIAPKRYTGSVNETTPGDDESLIYLLAGGDHTAHISFKKNNGNDKEKRYIDHCTGKWTTSEKDSENHYNKPLNIRHGLNPERVTEGDPFSPYIIGENDWRYDNGIWVTHASRGDRGVMAEYLFPESSFGKTITSASTSNRPTNMQYMLFENTLPASCDKIEPDETCVIYNESAGNVTQQECKKHSHWKALIEAYNEMESLTR